METIAVIDFETTGLSPNLGDRPTEIGVVLLRGGAVVDRYESLMNAGVRIPAFVEQLTGITNAMVRRAPPVDRVMREAADFVGDLPLAAHNAGFDRRFWDAELRRLGRAPAPDFACSMLIARRVLPDSPNHRLDTLIDALGLPPIGRHHRALADAEAAAHLLEALRGQLARRFRLPRVPHALLLAVQKASRARLAECVDRHRAASPQHEGRV